MVLSILTALTGTISAVSVLISLLFVRRQIHQSVKNQRALIQQGRAWRSADIVMHLMQPDFAEAYHRCLSGDDDVTSTQLVQFIGYSRAIFLGAEDSFLQHRDGLLDELAFSSFRRSLVGIFVSPGIKASWSILREWYDGEFAGFVDGIVKECNRRPHVVQHEEWKKHVRLNSEAQSGAADSFEWANRAA